MKFSTIRKKNVIEKQMKEKTRAHTQIYPVVRERYLKKQKIETKNTRSIDEPLCP